MFSPLDGQDQVSSLESNDALKTTLVQKAKEVAYLQEDFEPGTENGEIMICDRLSNSATEIMNLVLERLVRRRHSLLSTASY